MLRYVVRRTVWAAAVFVAVTLGTYVTFFVVAERTLSTGQGRAARIGQTGLAQHLEQLHDPVVVQYARYLRQLAGGSLGSSDSTRQSVNDVVLRALPVTASLIAGALVIWLAIAIVVGVHSALRPRSLLDRLSMVAVLVGISAHPVWIGLVLGYVLGYKWHLFPVTGYCDFFQPAAGRCGGAVQWAWHLLLPWLTLAIFYAATYVRMVRSNVMESLDEDWVRTARAKGAAEGRVVRRHVLRNALLPVVAMLGMDIGLAIGAAGFVEVVYGLPGLGRVAIEHLGLIRTVETGNYAQLDLPVIAGATVVITAAIILCNLVADLLFTWVDPRIDPNGDPI